MAHGGAMHWPRLPSGKAYLMLGAFVERAFLSENMQHIMGQLSAAIRA